MFDVVPMTAAVEPKIAIRIVVYFRTKLEVWPEKFFYLVKIDLVSK